MSSVTPATTANMSHLLKRMYPQRRVENLVYQDNPLFALIPKAKFEGAAVAITVRHADSMGRSAEFLKAQSGITPHSGKQFLLTTVSDYQLFSMSYEAILAGRDNAATLLNTLDTEVSSALNNAGRSLAVALYGDGSGSIGRRSSISTNTITLTNVNDVTNFEVGQVLAAGSSLTGALRSGTSAVTAVDRSAGTVTVASAAAISSFADNDYLFVSGDAANNGGTPLRLSGLESWNPSSAPGATAFFGVDRSADTDRLGGIRIDISTYNPEEGLIVAMSRLARDGGRPSHLFLNYVDSRNVQLALGARVENTYTQVGDIGFSGIRIRGPKGDVMIHPDQNAPSGVGRLLTLSTWALYHRGELLNIQDMDGSKYSRLYDADGYEGRISFYGQLGCTAPGFNARLVMPT